jgi:hypothetical protein
MVSEKGLRNRGFAVTRSQDVLARYVARHPNLRDDFILVARQARGDDVVVITVADIAGEGSKGTPSDVRLLPKKPGDSS